MRHPNTLSGHKTKIACDLQKMKIRRCLLISCIIFICCAVPPLSFAQDDVSVIIKQIQPSLVTVLTYDRDGEFLGQGNGFFIGNNGDVITNVHVLQGAASAQVKTAYKKVYAVTGVLALDKEGDLARVSVDIPPRAVCPLTFSTNLPETGERVIVIGSPSGPEQKVSDGVISGVREIPTFGTVIKITALMSPGGSCSPVVNMNGDVIGVTVVQTIEGQGLNFAIHSGRVIKLIPDTGMTHTKWVEGETNEWYSSAEGFFNQGIFYLAADDRQYAMQSFEKAAKKNPRYAAAYFFIGYCNDALGRYSEAIEVYKQAIRIDPYFVEAHANLGVAYHRLGRYTEAVDVYKHVLRTQPENAEAHDKLGEVYGMIGRHTEAIKAFRQAIRIMPDFADAYSHLGQACFNLGRYTESVTAYKQVIHIRPDDAGAYSMMGAAYDKLEHYAEAIEACTQAISLKPDFTDAYSHLGQACFNLGRYMESIAAYKQVIHIKPDDAEAYSMMGAAYDKLERYAEAIEAYKQAIQIKPDNAGVRRMLCMAYFKLKHYTEAITAYKQAVAIKPDDASAYYSMGVIYGILGRYQEEAEAYMQAVRIKPDFAEAHLGLGIVYLNHGDKKLALEEYKILRDLDKDSANGLFNLIYK
jgi:tetratricopeptide (TPR) repeat protein